MSDNTELLEILNEGRRAIEVLHKRHPNCPAVAAGHAVGDRLVKHLALTGSLTDAQAVALSGGTKE